MSSTEWIHCGRTLRLWSIDVQPAKLLKTYHNVYGTFSFLWRILMVDMYVGKNGQERFFCLDSNLALTP